MKSYFQFMECIREATAVASEPIAKRSWNQLKKELGGTPNYSNIGHDNVDPIHYSIYGIKKRIPFEIWWTDDGSTIKRKKATKSTSDVFLMHGIAGQTGAGGYVRAVGGDMSRYKGRIDHERKAMSMTLGGIADDGGILRLRALEKGVGGMVRKMKQLYPKYALHYWNSEGKVEST